MNYERFAVFYSVFQRETDRGAVLFGAAKLDDLCRTLLERCLVPADGGHEDLLLDRALRDFGARVRAARRLGLIDKDVEDALRAVGEIRNQFAHRLEASSLALPAYAVLVGRLYSLLSPGGAFKKMRSVTAEIPTSPGNDFRLAVGWLAAVLETAGENVPRLRADPLISADGTLRGSTTA